MGFIYKSPLAQIELEPNFNAPLKYQSERYFGGALKFGSNLERWQNRFLPAFQGRVVSTPLPLIGDQNYKFFGKLNESLFRFILFFPTHPHLHLFCFFILIFLFLFSFCFFCFFDFFKLANLFIFRCQRAGSRT